MKAYRHGENLLLKIDKIPEEQKEIFSKGRESVLDDFDNLCQADAFLGFSEDEFNAVKKFFRFNSKLRSRNNN